MTISRERSDFDAAESLSNEISPSWLCGCGKLQVFGGGRPFDFGSRDTCNVCESRVASKPADRAAVAAVIDKHLL